MTGLTGIILIGLGVILIAMTIGFLVGRRYSEACIDMFVSELVNKGYVTVAQLEQLREDLTNEREGEEK